MTALLWIAVALGADPEVLHRGIPPTSVESAFLTTHVAVQQGAGLLTIRDFRVPDLGRFDLRLAGATEELDVQVKARPWLAMGVRLGGDVVTGLNVDSAFIAGVDSGVFADVGARIALRQRARSVWSTRIFVYGERGVSLTPAPLADAFATDRWDTVSALLRGRVLEYVLGRRRTITTGASLAGAWDLGRRVGLQASIRGRVGSASYLGFGDEEPQRTSRTALAFGVAGDWKPEGKVPLGAQLEVSNRQESEGWLVGDLRASGVNRLLTAATLAYTGREELHLGVTVGALFPTIRPQAEQLGSIEGTFRYDF